MSAVGRLQCLMSISQYLAYYFLFGSAGRKRGGRKYVSQGCKLSPLYLDCNSGLGMAIRPEHGVQVGH